MPIDDYYYRKKAGDSSLLTYQEEPLAGRIDMDTAWDNILQREEECRAQLWDSLRPGMLLELKVASNRTTVVVFPVSVNGTATPPGTNGTIVATKIVLLLSVSSVADGPRFMDFILGDSIWRMFDRSDVVISILSRNSF